MWTSHSGKSSFLIIYDLYFISDTTMLYFTIYINHAPITHTFGPTIIRFPFYSENELLAPSGIRSAVSYIKANYLNSLVIIPLSHRGRMQFNTLCSFIFNGTIACIFRWLYPSTYDTAHVVLHISGVHSITLNDPLSFPLVVPVQPWSASRVVTYGVICLQVMVMKSL